MILGFAHITVNIEKNEFQFEVSQLTNAFFEFNLENAKPKKSLMLCPDSKYNLALSKDDGIELICYENYESSPYNKVIEILGKRDFKILVRQGIEIEQEVFFWTSLFINCIQDDLHKISFRRPIKSWCCSLIIEESSQNQTNACLDRTGPVALAFYVTDLYGELKRIRDTITCYTTEIFNYEIFNQKMNIAFICSPSGVFVELIEVLNEKNN